MLSSGSLNTSRKWMNSLGLNPWMLTCGNLLLMCDSRSRYHCFVSFGMMPALHQNLCPAERDGLLDLAVHLIVRDDVGVGVLFRPIKRAELAIDVADVGVIDIAVNDVGDDFVAAAVEILRLGELSAAVGERAKLLERQMIEPSASAGSMRRPSQTFCSNSSNDASQVTRLN